MQKKNNNSSNQEDFDPSQVDILDDYKYGFHVKENYINLSCSDF